MTDIERQQFAERAAGKMVFYAKRVPTRQPRKRTIVRTGEQPKGALLRNEDLFRP